MKLTEEQIALLGRIAPKASEAVRKMHGLATCRDPEKRGEFIYMHIPSRAEEDADCILYELAARAPDLVADLIEAQDALVELYMALEDRDDLPSSCEIDGAMEKARAAIGITPLPEAAA